jgi:hypothetical protein
MLVPGGRTIYGVPVGVLIMDTKFPRLPGDIGYAPTWPFPVIYHRVAGAIPHRLAVAEPDPEFVQPLLDGARGLEADGVRAIVTTCGYLAAHQATLAAAVSVPVFTSALLQVPLAARCIRPDQRVGIITARAVLNETYFRGAGWSAGDIDVVQFAPAEDSHFAATYVRDGTEIDVERVHGELAELTRTMTRDHPDVGAIVLECANLAPFSQTVRAASGLPVFDLYTLTMHAYQATCGPDFLRPPLR